MAVALRVAGSRPAGHCGCISAARKETAHGTVPARRRTARDLGREPDGDRRLRVRRVLPSGSGGARPAVQGHWLLARGEAPLEGRDALPSGRRQLHPQRGAAILRGAVCRRARALGAGDGLPRCRRQAGLRARHRHGREAGEDRGRADGARHPGNRGHRRPADLSRRPLRREGLDLRRRFQLDRRPRPASARLRPALHRPPDPQRPARAHERVGRVLTRSSSTSARSSTSTSPASSPACIRAP